MCSCSRACARLELFVGRPNSAGRLIRLQPSAEEIKERPHGTPNSKGGRRLMGARGRLSSGPSATGRSITGSRFAQFRAPARLCSARFGSLRYGWARLEQPASQQVSRFISCPGKQLPTSWQAAPMAAVQVPTSASLQRAKRIKPLLPTSAPATARRWARARTSEPSREHNWIELNREQLLAGRLAGWLAASRLVAPARPVGICAFSANWPALPHFRASSLTPGGAQFGWMLKLGAATRSKPRREDDSKRAEARILGQGFRPKFRA